MKIGWPEIFAKYFNIVFSGSPFNCFRVVLFVGMKGLIEILRANPRGCGRV